MDFSNVMKKMLPIFLRIWTVTDFKYSFWLRKCQQWEIIVLISWKFYNGSMVVKYRELNPLPSRLVVSYGDVSANKAKILDNTFKNDYLYARSAAVVQSQSHCLASNSPDSISGRVGLCQPSIVRNLDRKAHLEINCILLKQLFRDKLISSIFLNIMFLHRWEVFS